VQVVRLAGEAGLVKGCDRSSALRCHLNVALCHTWR
jgi:hypothetical protein